jgi:hypothetical protein
MEAQGGMLLFKTYFDISGIGGHIGIPWPEGVLWSVQGQLSPQRLQTGGVDAESNPSIFLI